MRETSSTLATPRGGGCRPARLGFLVLSSVCGMLLGTFVVPIGEAEELRDPFMFGPRAETSAQSRAVLLGILWDATHPLAIVGDQMVAIGDHLGEWRVVEIHPDQIVLERAGRRESVIIGQPLPTD